MGDRVLPGILLVALGALLLVAQQLHVGGEIAVALVGAAFLIGYAFTREYGLLVPGGILTGLGIGIVVEVRATTDSGAPVLLGLGLGFISVYVLDRLVHLAREPRRSGWWPLIPGGVLTLIGLGLASQAQGLLRWIGQWWPVLLILAGLWILLRRPAAKA